MQLCKQSARNGKKQSRQDKSAGGRNGKTDLGKGNREAIAAGQINALAMRRKPVSAETRRQRRRKPQTHPFFVGRAGVARSEKGDKKPKKGIGLLPIPIFSPSRERRLFSRSFRPRAARSPLARDFLPDAVGKSSGVRIRERRSFFRFMVFTTHHCRRLFQKVIRDESILTLFNHFVTSCRLNPRFRDIFLFLYRFAFSPLINSESLSGSRSFCARISCAFYCADLTPSDLKAQSLRFRS